MKIYAVRKGKKTGKFYNWETCKFSIDGFSGAEYKSFKTEHDADVYLGLVKEDNSPKMEKLENEVAISEDNCIAYVDGSFNSDNNTYSCGVVLLTSDNVLEFASKDNDSEFTSYRNISGELFGVMLAILKAESLGKKSIEILHDLRGSGCWADNEWRANNDLTVGYVNFISRHRCVIDIKFKWIKGHSGDKYNTKADKIALKAMSEEIKYRLSNVLRDCLDL